VLRNVAGGGTVPLRFRFSDEPIAKEEAMLWTIVVILVILWLLGFSLHVAGGLIHILLVIALIVGLVQLFTGRRV
jgi:hypothetical protein